MPAAVALLAFGPDRRIVRDALAVLAALMCGEGVLFAPADSAAATLVRSCIQHLWVREISWCMRAVEVPLPKCGAMTMRWADTSAPVDSTFIRQSLLGFLPVLRRRPD